MAEFGSVQDDRSVFFVLISIDWPPERERWTKVAPSPPPAAANAIHTPPLKKIPPRAGYRIKVFVTALYIAGTIYISVTGQFFKKISPYISCKVDLYIAVT